MNFFEQFFVKIKKCLYICSPFRKRDGCSLRILEDKSTSKYRICFLNEFERNVDFFETTSRIEYQVQTKHIIFFYTMKSLILAQDER